MPGTQGNVSFGWFYRLILYAAFIGVNIQPWWNQKNLMALT